MSEVSNNESNSAHTWCVIPVVFYTPVRSQIQWSAKAGHLGEDKCPSLLSRCGHPSRGQARQILPPTAQQKPSHQGVKDHEWHQTYDGASQQGPWGGLTSGDIAEEHGTIILEQYILQP